MKRMTMKFNNAFKVKCNLFVFSVSGGVLFVVSQRSNTVLNGKYSLLPRSSDKIPGTKS